MRHHGDARAGSGRDDRSDRLDLRVTHSWGAGLDLVHAGGMKCSGNGCLFGGGEGDAGCLFAVWCR
jgi:hypothetical protein